MPYKTCPKCGTEQRGNAARSCYACQYEFTSGKTKPAKAKEGGKKSAAGKRVQADTGSDARDGRQADAPTADRPDDLPSVPAQEDGSGMPGTRDYADLGRKVGDLVTEKQAAYGDSFGRSGQVMCILYPNGITAEQMHDALAVVRIVDKLFRIATDKNALGESPYRDIAGYGLLGAARSEQA